MITAMQAAPATRDRGGSVPAIHEILSGAKGKRVSRPLLSPINCENIVFVCLTGVFRKLTWAELAASGVRMESVPTVYYLTIDQVLRAYEEGWFRCVQDAGVPCGPVLIIRPTAAAAEGPSPGDSDRRPASTVRVFFS